MGIIFLKLARRPRSPAGDFARARARSAAAHGGKAFFRVSNVSTSGHKRWDCFSFFLHTMRVEKVNAIK
jgi:hypothetical protein